MKRVESIDKRDKRAESIDNIERELELYLNEEFGLVDDDDIVEHIKDERICGTIYDIGTIVFGGISICILTGFVWIHEIWELF